MVKWEGKKPNVIYKTLTSLAPTYDQMPNTNQVLDGFYIVDGSVIPGAIAANPSFTIAAQALKAVTKALP